MPACDAEGRNLRARRDGQQCCAAALVCASQVPAFNNGTIAWAHRENESNLVSGDPSTHPRIHARFCMHALCMWRDACPHALPRAMLPMLLPTLPLPTPS